MLELMARISYRVPLISDGTLAIGGLKQHLTECEWIFIWAFMFRGGLTLDQLAELTWGHGWDWPLSYRCGVEVRLTNLRKKLEPFGWTIRVVGRQKKWLIRL